MIEFYIGCEETYDNPDEFLEHYGVKRRSGRYPWGSGEQPFQRSGDFLSRVEELAKQGVTYTDEKGKQYTGNTAIAKTLGMSTTQFRTQLSLAKNERRSLEAARAKALREDGKTLQEITDIMGYKNDSSIRALLNEDTAARKLAAQATADFLKQQIDSKGMIDVGSGVNLYCGGISPEKMRQALEIIQTEGYQVYKGRIPQATNPEQWTTLMVAAGPKSEYKDMYDYKNIKSIQDFTTDDGGDTFNPVWTYPKSMDSNRLKVRYAEEGGLGKDGMVEIRPNVDDLSLGNSAYSQVRILVDNKSYIKGMATYGDPKDFPDGVDVIFNTNKTVGTPVNKVLKNIKDNPHNPFGSLIKPGIDDPDNPGSQGGGQSYYYDKNGKKQLSLINKRSDEGDWNEWSNKLPAQFLSKQPIALAKQQLKLATAQSKEEFEKICSLENPTLKKKLLETFANDCDSSAVHLKAASLPGQEYKVILPIPSLKDNEIYAPHLKQGQEVALVRFPHGGQFEIPIVKNNTKNAEGQRVMGKTPKDAVGINAKVASQLSGADFDGDTVLVLPIGRKSPISNKKPLEGLKNFDPTMRYGPDNTDPVRVDPKTGREYYKRGDREYSRMKNTQTEMGIISNLITDMTIKGADSADLAKAVRHSMVVIDAEKHKLDYKQSYIDNDIATLKQRYQGHIGKDGKYHEGVSTLISRSKNEVDVDKRVGTPHINQKGKDWYDPSKPEGALLYKSVKEEYVGKDGKIHTRTQKSTQMAEASDARDLISDYNSPHERVYADYANGMKALANQARKEQVYTPNLKYDATAATKYRDEVNHLKAQLNTALMNAPRERQAQILANTTIKAVKDDNPDITKGELKKIRQQSLTKARTQVDAHRINITISDREWEAIQAGAVSDNVLKQILDHTDTDALRKRAMPSSAPKITQTRIGLMQSYKASGYTTAEIAEKLGVSASTVSKYLNE